MGVLAASDLIFPEKYFWENFHGNFSEKLKNLEKLKNIDLEKINVNSEQEFFMFPIAVKYYETQRSVKKSEKISTEGTDFSSQSF